MQIRSGAAEMSVDIAHGLHAAAHVKLGALPILVEVAAATEQVVVDVQLRVGTRLQITSARYRAVRADASEHAIDVADVAHAGSEVRQYRPGGQSLMEVLARGAQRRSVDGDVRTGMDVVPGRENAGPGFFR